MTKQTEASKSQKNDSKFSTKTKTMTMPFQNFFRYFSLALVRRLFLHKYMSHRNAINLMAFNDIGGSEAKNLCLRVKVVERFLYILSNSNENIQILKIFFSCSFDEFSCKVDSKEGSIML